MMAMAKRVLPIAPVSSLLFLVLLLPTLQPAEAQIGVCYGRAGSNVPSPQAAMNLCKSNGIGAMRIYDLDQETLQAAHDAGIQLVVAVPNDNLQSIGTDPNQAAGYVQTYVQPYASSIKYIVVGNEVTEKKPEAAQYVGPAMQNVLNALNSASIGGQIKVTTAIGTALVSNAYPPSNGVFNNLAFMQPVVNFLVANGSPLFLNVYTYFPYADPSNTGQIPLDYALFVTPNTAEFNDPNNGLHYSNLFDALVDATYAAINKIAPASTMSNSGGKVPIHEGESGWGSSFGPSAMYYTNENGGATPGNAQTYYSNLISHLKQGTPLMPGPMEGYLFELFDENQKPGDSVEQHFGIFNSDLTPKYQLNFS